MRMLIISLMYGDYQSADGYFAWIEIKKNVWMVTVGLSAYQKFSKISGLVKIAKNMTDGSLLTKQVKWWAGNTFAQRKHH